VQLVPGANAYAVQYSYFFAHAVLDTTSFAVRGKVRYALRVAFAGRVVDVVGLGPGDVGGGWVTRRLAGIVVGSGVREADLEIAWGVEVDEGGNAVWSEVGIDDVGVTLVSGGEGAC